MVKVYGIPNCNTVKKALAWLTENKIAFEFHDFKKTGASAFKIKEWVKASSLEIVLNKKSTAYRNLTAEDQQKILLKSEALNIMQNNTNLIKRPVLEIAGTILHGFNIEEYKKTFGKN